MASVAIIRLGRVCEELPASGHASSRGLLEMEIERLRVFRRRSAGLRER